MRVCVLCSSASFPSDVTKLQEAYVASQRYVLLLALMQFLKESFGITDRCQLPLQYFVTRLLWFHFPPFQIMVLCFHCSV